MDYLAIPTPSAPPGAIWNLQARSLDGLEWALKWAERKLPGETQGTPRQPKMKMHIYELRTQNFFVTFASAYALSQFGLSGLKVGSTLAQSQTL